MKLFDQHEKAFQDLWDAFADWNSKINLSAIRDKEGFLEKHVKDSLLVTEFFDLRTGGSVKNSGVYPSSSDVVGNSSGSHLTSSSKNKVQSSSKEQASHSQVRVLDLGSGGGFPLLPLALTHPDISFTGMDSVGKKMKAVAAIADTCGLKNVQTIHGRFEELGQEKMLREKFDVVVARAVAPWHVLLEYALPFVKVGGRFIAYQGPEILEEDLGGTAHLLGGRIGDIHKTTLGEAQRVFVEVQKIKPTPGKYPRANGVPRKEPLS